MDVDQDEETAAPAAAQQEETTPPPSGDAPPQIPAQTGPPLETTPTPVNDTIPQSQQQPQQGPVVLHEAPHEGFRGVLDRVLDAIAGKSDSKIYRDDQGNEFVQHPDKSAGEKWARVADLAITGAAEGLANGRGAGNMGKGLLSAVQAGKQIGGQDQATDQANQAEVKNNRIAQANYNLLSQKMIENQFALTRMQQEAQDHDLGYEKTQIDQENALKSIPLGTYKGIADLPDLQKQHPEVIKDFYNSKNIVVIPHIDAQTGKHDGASFYLRRPGVTDQVLPAGTSFHVPVMNDQGDYELATHHTTEPMTQGEIDQLNMAAHTTMGSQAKDKADRAKEAQATALSAAEIPLKKAQTGEAVSATAKNFAEARKASMEATASSNVGDDLESQANALVDNRAAVSQLNKRGKELYAVINRANQISMQKNGVPFDETANEIGYKARTLVIESATTGDIAKTIESFDKFAQHTLAASEAVNFARNTSAPLVNMPMNAISKLTGDKRSPAVIALLAADENVRKEYESLLSSGRALTESDKQAGSTILSDSASPAQKQAAYKQLIDTGIARLRAADYTYSRTMHAHIPDLISPDAAKALQHFGFDPNSVYSGASAQPGGQNGGAPPVPPGAAGTAKGSDGKLHYVDSKGTILGVAE